jgi:hypothetical protein
VSLSLPVGVLGLIRLAVPVWAEDFSAEIDFKTRAQTASPWPLRSRGSQPIGPPPADDHLRAVELEAAAEGSGATVPKTLGPSGPAAGVQRQVPGGVRPRLIRRSARRPLEWSHPLGRPHGGGRYEKLHALAIKMIPITEAQLKDVQALAGD